MLSFMMWWIVKIEKKNITFFKWYLKIEQLSRVMSVPDGWFWEKPYFGHMEQIATILITSEWTLLEIFDLALW